MKIAVTIWGDRVSPVFDASDTIVIADIENKQIIQKYYQQFDPANWLFLESFRKSGIDVLICGAISKTAEKRIAQSKIELLAFITGNTDEVMDLFLTCDEIPQSYIMPGIDLNGKWNHQYCRSCAV